MRSLVLILGLLIAPVAEAAPLNPLKSLATLAGAFVGGAGGGVLGIAAYGVADPYGHEDSVEWVLAGGIAGFGIGAPIGGSLAHTIAGGRAAGQVLLFSGLVGGAAAGCALYAPATERRGKATDTTWILFGTGAGLAIAGAPMVATITSSLLGGRNASAAIVPVVGPRQRGLSLVVRY